MSNGPYVPNVGLNLFPPKFPAAVQPLPPLADSGSPEGVIAANPGTGYTDLDTNDFYVKVVGTSVQGWQQIGKSLQSIFAGKSGQVFSGSATDPNGVLTAIGPAYYYSITDQSQWEKTGAGSTNTGWTKFLG